MLIMVEGMSLEGVTDVLSSVPANSYIHGTLIRCAEDSTFLPLTESPFATSWEGLQT